jgi:hypothetical protein
LVKHTCIIFRNFSTRENCKRRNFSFPFLEEVSSRAAKKGKAAWIMKEENGPELFSLASGTSFFGSLAPPSPSLPSARSPSPPPSSRVWNRLEPCKVDNACYLKEGEGRGGKGRGEGRER